MVDRFGEFVSYKPKVKPATYLLWYGPWALLILGLVVITLMVGRRASKQNTASSNEPVSEEQAKHDKDSQGEDSQSPALDQHEQVEQLLSRFKDD
jgi:cytochrome c-type biogenesis protein CcmH